MDRPGGGQRRRERRGDVAVRDDDRAGAPGARRARTSSDARDGPRDGVDRRRVAVDRDLELDPLVRAAGELLERPGGDEAARGEEADPVAQRLDLAQDVRREQDRQVALGDEAPEQREQLLDARRVDRDRRLVEDEDRRLLDQGVGDAEALAHAARVRLGLLVGGVVEPDLVEQLVDPRLGDGPRQAVELGRVAQVLAAGQAAVEAHVVGQVADLALDRERLAGRDRARRPGRCPWSARSARAASGRSSSCRRRSGPSRPNTSPARIVRSSDSTAVKSPYCLVRRRATMTASAGTSARTSATVRRRRSRGSPSVALGGAAVAGRDGAAVPGWPRRPVVGASCPPCSAAGCAAGARPEARRTAGVGWSLIALPPAVRPEDPVEAREHGDDQDHADDPPELRRLDADADRRVVGRLGRPWR